MQNILRKYIYLFTVLACCVGQQATQFFSVQLEALEEEITVHLDTEKSLLPIFLGEIQGEETSFSRSYLEQLRAVLAFDFQHNGMTRVLTMKESQNFQFLKKEEGFANSIHFKDAQDANIHYLIRGKIEDKTLLLKLISINGQTVKIFDGIVLSGDLAKDRILLHKIHDVMHEILFQKRGIAGTKILFTIRKKIQKEKSADWISEVFEQDYDGANRRQITNEGAYAVNPVWIPPQEGKKSIAFLYVSYKIGQPKLHIGSLKDGKSMRLSSLRGSQMTPCISHDASQIVFSCDITGTSDLFIQPFSKEAGTLGKPRHLYAAKKSAQASATFAPDDKKIAFVSDKDGFPKIYIMDVSAGEMVLKNIKPLLVSKRCKEGSSPSWSPLGNLIAYSGKSPGDSTRQIWLYDFDTNTERQLTHGKGQKENPTWAPNGLHLAFDSTASDGTTDLYFINLHQKEAVKITQGTGDKRFPSWGTQ